MVVVNGYRLTARLGSIHLGLSCILWSLNGSFCTLCFKNLSAISWNFGLDSFRRWSVFYPLLCDKSKKLRIMIFVHLKLPTVLSGPQKHTLCDNTVGIVNFPLDLTLDIQCYPSSPKPLLRLDGVLCSKVFILLLLEPKHIYISVSSLKGIKELCFNFIDHLNSIGTDRGLPISYP